MHRRQFITILSGAAAGSFAAHAQRRMPVIGFFNGQFRHDITSFVTAFRAGLGSAGYTEGNNVAIEYHYAEGRRDEMPSMAAEIVRRGVDIIVTGGGTPVTLAAKAATTTIPIVFTMGGDPVQLGVVASLNRPGGNATGANYFFNALGAKRLEILREFVPAGKVIGYLVNPTNPSLEAETRELFNAARALGFEVRVEKARTTHELDAAFASFAQQAVDAFMIAADIQFTLLRDRLTALAARYRLPGSYHSREIVDAGGLTSYGPSQTDAYRQAGIYAGRILSGEKPADLPVVQATRFELIVNLKTAKVLGLDVPATLLARADEVIE